jgi:hypothetical protein
MLTLEDCIGLSGVEPGEIEAVAEHEGLTFVVALEKGAWLLEHSWGPPALRQMIRDDLEDAAHRGAINRRDDLRAVYLHACERLPAGNDRRHGERHHHS